MNLNGIEIQWLGHASFKIVAAGKNIYIDPFQIKTKTNDADYIFLTHPHYDHCSLEDLQKVVKEGTKIILQIDCQSKVARLSTKVDMIVISLGDKRKIDELKIEAVAAYNIGKEFHPKAQQWLGYIITVAGKRIYHSGDADVIPEMENLGHIDLALLPVSGTYVMTAEEAAQAAEKIKPIIAIPMHYSSIVGSEADADKFISLCAKNGIKAEKMQKS